MFRIKVKNYRVEGSDDTIARLEREEVVNLISKEYYTEKEMLYAVLEMKLHKLKTVHDYSRIMLYKDNERVLTEHVSINHINGELTLRIEMDGYGALYEPMVEKVCTHLKNAQIKFR